MGTKRTDGRRQHGRTYVDGGGRHNAPEEVEEPERLDDHARERPLDEDEHDAAEEADRAAQLLPPREEVERLVGPDDERQPRDEQDLRSEVWVLVVCGGGGGGSEWGKGTHVAEREERAIEEEHDAEEHEERAERRQRDADFCGGSVRWRAAGGKQQLTLCVREPHVVGGRRGRRVQRAASSGRDVDPVGDSLEVTRRCVRGAPILDGPACAVVFTAAAINKNAQIIFAHCYNT